MELKISEEIPEKRDPVGRRWVVRRRSEYPGEEISQVSCRCSGKEKSVGGKKMYYNKIVFRKNEVYSDKHCQRKARCIAFGK